MSCNFKAFAEILCSVRMIGLPSAAKSLGGAHRKLDGRGCRRASGKRLLFGLSASPGAEEES